MTGFAFLPIVQRFRRQSSVATRLILRLAQPTIGQLLCLAFLLPLTTAAHAQEVSYWPFGFSEHWSNAPSVTSHDGPVTICVPESSDARCPSEAGWGIGMFRINGVVYNLFMGNSQTAANAQGDIEHFNGGTNPDHISDHVDAFFRDDSDGTYDRIFNFFALPRNGDIHTLADSSVRQEDAPDALPSIYQTSSSQGTDWQNAGMTGFVGPKLDTDPAGSQRVFAFTGFGSFPGDEGNGAHLMAFASVNVAAGVKSFSMPLSTWWKDANSANDPEYKLAHGIPLRTLHLKEFTPVILLRGEGGLPVHFNGAAASIVNATYLHGSSGWYHNGYFYLVVSLNLTQYQETAGCNGNANPETTGRLGMALIRVKADLTGTHGYGGLWLDSLQRPQVELYRVNGPLPRTFVPLPHPDQVISFREALTSATCNGGYNRQYFSGAGANPPEVAADFNLQYPADVDAHEEFLFPSSAFTFDGCTQYVIAGNGFPADLVPPGNTQAFIMKVADTNCGGDTPQFTFAHAGLIDYPIPPPAGQYSVNMYTSAAFPNLWPMTDNTTLLGYRTVLDTTTNREAQFSFTVVPSFFDCHFTVPPPIAISSAASTGSFPLTASGGGCPWEIKLASSFAGISSALSGNGSTTVSYSVTANSGVSGRLAHVWIGDQDFVIAQRGSLSEPTVLQATAQSNHVSVSVIWQAASGATGYELQRSSGGGPFSTIMSSSATSFTDTVSPNSVNLYRVRATSSGGTSLFSNLALASTFTFSDDPLVPHVTVIRAVHLNELRDAISAVRLASGLGSGIYTDGPAVALSTVIKATYITELRLQLDAALAKLGVAPPTYTDTTLQSAMTLIKAAHFQELRDAIK